MGYKIFNATTLTLAGELKVYLCGKSGQILPLTNFLATNNYTLVQIVAPDPVRNPLAFWVIVQEPEKLLHVVTWVKDTDHIIRSQPMTKLAAESMAEMIKTVTDNKGMVIINSLAALKRVGGTDYRPCELVVHQGNCQILRSQPCWLHDVEPIVRIINSAGIAGLYAHVDDSDTLNP